MANPHGRGPGLEGRRVRAGPGRDDAQARRGRARLRRGRREDGRARPAARHARRDHQGRHLRRRPRRSTTCGTRTARSAAGVADGRPSLQRDVHVCEAILALSGTTNGHLATAGLQDPREAHRARSWPTWPPSTRASRSPSPTPRPRPSPVITSPEWSGSETGGRRYSPFTINVERLKPWHTLTGRQHFYLDHDWMTELGEGLPVYRPPLNMAALFGEPRASARPGELGVDGALPDPAQQVVDPLRVPGQPVHALAVARRPDASG